MIVYASHAYAMRFLWENLKEESNLRISVQMEHVEADEDALIQDMSEHFISTFQAKVAC